MARPMQLVGTGSPKEDIVAKLMRTAFLIGLAVIWRPDAASGQYSWSNFSVSLGFGTGGSGFGIGASYAALDPFYDAYDADPCWDYAFYEWYPYTCGRRYDHIHIRQNYSVVSFNHNRRSRWPSYYFPYGYYGYPNHPHFSLSFGFNFGYGSPMYAYGYPTYAYGYPTYGYGYGYGYAYPAYGVVRYGGNRYASAAIRPALAYRGPPLMRSSPLYKESPRRGVERTAVPRSITASKAAAMPTASERRATSSGRQRIVREQPERARAFTTTRRSTRVRPSDAVSRGGADRTDGLRARRGSPTRLYPPTRATTSRRPSSPSRGASANTTPRSDPIPSVGSERSPQAAAQGRARISVPSTERPRATAQSRSGAPRPSARSRSRGVTRSMSLRERAPATRPAPSARAQRTGPLRGKTISPSRSRATQPSARSAPARTQPKARPSRSAAPRATPQRATNSRPRASSRGGARGTARTRATGPARSRSPRR